MKSLKGFYLLLTLFILTACGPANLPDDSLKNVPADITSVTAFNMNSLLQKADLEYIKSLDFYQDATIELKSGEQLIISTLEDPASSGLDLTKNAYLVSDIINGNPKDKFVGLVFSISDADLFESNINSIDLGKVNAENNYQYVREDNGVLAWNEEFGLLGMVDNKHDANQIATRFFVNDNASSVADNKDLKKCLDKEYDIAMWLNSNSLADNEQVKIASSLAGISHDALNDNFLHAYLNFEEGAIVGDANHFLRKELTNDLNLFFRDGIKQDLSKYIPADDLSLLVGASLDPKGIYQVVSEKIGGYALANKAIKKYGFTIKDISTAFGGDILIAAYGPTNVSMNQYEPNGLIVGSISKREMFNQFIELGIDLDIISKKGDNLYLVNLEAAPVKQRRPYMYVKDDLVFIISDTDILQKIQNGGYASAYQVNQDIYKNTVSNAFGTYINFANFDNLSNEKIGSPFSTMQFDAGLKQSGMRLEMKDKSMNSLKALFDFLNDSYLEREKKYGKETI